MTKRVFTSLSLTLGLLVAGFASHAAADGAVPAKQAVQSAKAHKTAADLGLKAPKDRAKASNFRLRDLKGKSVKLSKLKGDVVLVSFWATWCKPCLQELPHIDALAKKYKKKGLTALAISNDGPDTAARIPSVVSRFRLGLPVLHDKAGKAVAALNPRGNNPFTVLIDKKGRIAYAHEGYAPGDEAHVDVLVKALLAE